MDPISQLENAIVARLQPIKTELAASIPHLLIVPFPGTPEEYRKMAVQEGAIFVACRGSRFGPQLEQGSPEQQRTLSFEISLKLRDLRGHSGAYAILEAVRNKLQGFEIVSRVPLMAVRDGFLGLEDNYWVFTSTFEAELLNELVYNPVTSVTISGVSTLAIGEIRKLTATVAPADATNANVTWESDSDAVVVENGYVTGISAGTAIITVTTEDGEFTDAWEITVPEPDPAP